MTTGQTITSPAGEVIEVIPDEEWADALGWTDARQLKGRDRPRLAVLGALWEHGAYEDRSGFAGTALYEDAKARGYEGHQTSLNGLMRKTLYLGLDREVHGKRTTRVRLTAVPQTWADLLTANGDQQATPEPVEDDSIPVYLLDEPDEDRAPVEDAAAVIDVPTFADVQLEVAQSVASALLAQVVDIIATGKPDTSRLDALEADLDDARRRLATVLDANATLRRKLTETGDELLAAKTERDGLRTRLRLTEANLQKAINADRASVIQDAVNAELAKVMRATPIHRSPDDTPDNGAPIQAK